MACVQDDVQVKRHVLDLDHGQSGGCGVIETLGPSWCRHRSLLWIMQPEVSNLTGHHQFILKQTVFLAVRIVKKQVHVARRVTFELWPNYKCTYQVGTAVYSEVGLAKKLHPARASTMIQTCLVRSRSSGQYMRNKQYA